MPSEFAPASKTFEWSISCNHARIALSSFLRKEKKSFLSQKAGIICSSKSFLIFGDSSTRFLINRFPIKKQTYRYKIRIRVNDGKVEESEAML